MQLNIYIFEKAFILWVCGRVIPPSSLGSAGQAKEAPLAGSQTSELPRDGLALETLRSREESWKPYPFSLSGQSSSSPSLLPLCLMHTSLFATIPLKLFV